MPKQKKLTMTNKELTKILEEVKQGSRSVESVVEILRNFPYADLGFAKIDHQRELRTGYPEIIYCSGKTIEQVKNIFFHMSGSENNIIGTRATQEMFSSISEILPNAVYFETAKIISVQNKNIEKIPAPIGVITAGTSDIPVA